MENNPKGGANTSKVATTDQTTATTEPRNFFAAFLLVASFGLFGMHQIYLGNKTQGWVRFGLALASFPLMFVLVGFLILFVLWVWQIVDFFMIYMGKKVDAEGRPLAMTSRDETGARALFIVTIIMAVLYILSIIFSISFGLLAAIQENVTPSGPTTSPYDTSYNRFQ